MAQVPMPDVTVVDDDYAKIPDLYGDTVAVHRLNGGDFEITVADGGFAGFTAEWLAQFAELLRRMAAGEPLKD